MDFKKIDTMLMKHSKVRYNFDILNPLNKRGEFKKFQKDKTYNPQFRYPSFDAQKHISELEKLEIPKNSSLGKIFNEIRNNMLIEAKALENIGTDKFTTKGLFSSVKPSTLKIAKEILSKPIKIKRRL